MTTTTNRTSTLRKALLLGLWCSLLAAGCDNSPSESSSEPDQSNTAVEAISEPKAAEPKETNSNPQPATHQATTAPKPLDLSRGTNLDSLDEASDIGGTEPSNLLPDLFEDQPSKTGARASGRVLMSETEEASMQAIEGVEFTLKVPVN